MKEKVYKTMSSTGTMNVVLGVIALTVGVATGVLLIIGGAKLIAGKSIEETFPILKAQGDVEIKGLMVSLNRMEKGLGGKVSALAEIKEKYGFDARAIVTMEDVITHLYNKPYKGQGENKAKIFQKNGEKRKMKKRILSVLLIALLTAGVAFADFTFSGNFDVGYTFGFDGTTELTAVDGDNSAPRAGFFYLKGGNEYISLDVRSEADVDGGSIVRGSGIAMTGTINLSNILNTMFTMEMPVAIELYAGNQTFSSDADYAYGDSHGKLCAGSAGRAAGSVYCSCGGNQNRTSGCREDKGRYYRDAPCGHFVRCGNRLCGGAAHYGIYGMAGSAGKY